MIVKKDGRMSSLPAVIEHVEINPTGGCKGFVVQEAEHSLSWECSECDARYWARDLYYLSGDYIGSYSADYLSNLRQDDMRDLFI
jgi:hypothetical protein